MNCFAGCRHIAGTVNTQVMSSSVNFAVDWLNNSCNTWSLKNFKA